MTTFFTRKHEWIKVADDDSIQIGITDYAQDQLGDVVFVELPKLNKEYLENDILVVIESVKAAGEIDSPVPGVVTRVNEALIDKPELVNTSPMEEGWLVYLSPILELDTSQLMDYNGYQRWLERQS